MYYNLCMLLGNPVLYLIILISEKTEHTLRDPNNQQSLTFIKKRFKIVKIYSVISETCVWKYIRVLSHLRHSSFLASFFVYDINGYRLGLILRNSTTLLYLVVGRPNVKCTYTSESSHDVLCSRKFRRGRTKVDDYFAEESWKKKTNYISYMRFAVSLISVKYLNILCINICP